MQQVNWDTAQWRPITEIMPWTTTVTVANMDGSVTSVEMMIEAGTGNLIPVPAGYVPPKPHGPVPVELSKLKPGEFIAQAPLAIFGDPPRIVQGPVPPSQ